MRTAGKWTAAAACAVIVLAGCSGSGDTPGGDTAGDDTAAEQGGGEASVTIADFTFSPSSAEVRAGGTLTWSNSDSTGHTATSGSPGSPDGRFDEEVPGGGEASVTLEEPGTYDYFCRFHPRMTGSVTVAG